MGLAARNPFIAKWQQENCLGCATFVGASLPSIFCANTYVIIPLRPQVGCTSRWKGHTSCGHANAAMTFSALLAQLPLH